MKNETKNVRHLTVGEQSQPRRWHWTKVPEIRLSGKWLNQSGFKPTDKVRVVVQKKKLIIIPDK